MTHVTRELFKVLTFILKKLLTQAPESMCIDSIRKGQRKQLKFFQSHVRCAPKNFRQWRHGEGSGDHLSSPRGRNSIKKSSYMICDSMRWDRRWHQSQGGKGVVDKSLLKNVGRNLGKKHVCLCALICLSAVVLLVTSLVVSTWHLARSLHSGLIILFEKRSIPLPLRDAMIKLAQAVISWEMLARQYQGIMYYAKAHKRHILLVYWWGILDILGSCSHQ